MMSETTIRELRKKLNFGKHVIAIQENPWRRGIRFRITNIRVEQGIPYGQCLNSGIWYAISDAEEVL